MRLISLLAVLLVVGCAHSPPPPPGPRPLGMDASLVRGQATLAVRFRYEVVASREVALLVDLEAGGAGSVGTLDVKVVADGLTVAGPATWNGEVAAGTTTALRFPLQATRDGLARVTITHGLAGAVASDPVVVRFLVSADEIRACQASEEDCKDPGASP